MGKYQMEKNFTILGSVQVTQEMFDWFNLLTKNDESRIEAFTLIHDESPTIPSSIIRYRRRLLEQQSQDLQINEGTLEEIAEQLQGMFLEPISPQYAKQIQRVMTHTGWSWNDVVEAHYQDKEKRIWRIISCKNKRYIF